MTNESKPDSQADEAAATEVDEVGPASAGPAAPSDQAAQPESEPAKDAREPEQPTIVINDKRRIDPNGSVPKPPASAPAAAAKAAASVEDEDEDNGQLDELRNGLDELTRDLQRVTAEYANYRKRVDRDRMLVAEQATGAVLTQLLPVLDDLDRARNHGDLVGPFASVAEQLSAIVGKFGLIAFGDVGDPFDPTLHEAVAHTSSPDVTETACVEIMRRGYLLGERLLRPALVAVADPE